MQASPRRLWLVVVLSAWCVRQGAADQAMEIVHQLLKDSLAGCHVVLVVTSPESPLLSFVDRYETEAQRQARRGFVLTSASMAPRHALRAVVGDRGLACRGIIMHLDNTTTNNNKNSATSSILELLELGALRKMPGMRVVVVGDEGGVEDVLLHHSLRNTIHGLYLVPQQRRHLSQANASLSTQSLTPRLPNASSHEGGGEPVTVYRRCRYCKAGQKGVQDLGLWRASDARLNPLFFDKDEQFNGHRFHIVSTPYVPYIDLRREKSVTGTTIKPTISIEKYLLEEFTKRLNFTYVIHERQDGKWGLPVNGSFTGMMGQLEREEVDYCTLCGMTDTRNRVIDHLQSYPADGITVVSLKPSLLPQHFLLVRPLTGRVWAGVVASIVLWGSVMGCFDALLKRISRRDHLGVNTSFLLGWGAVLEQSVVYLPISVSKRTLLSVWLTFSLIIVSAYKSSLIANLSVQGKVNTPETLSDLVRAKNWKWGTEEFVFKGYPFEYFSKHKDPIVHKVYMAMKVLPPDVALRRVMKGHFSMVNYENYVIIYINTHFTDPRGRTPFQLSRRSLAIMAAYGWGLRKGAPFYNSYRHLVTHMQAGGLMDYWMQQVVIESKKKSKEAEPFTYDNSREYSKDESVKVVLGLTHLDGAFYLFFLGTAAAFFTFFVEIIAGRGHNKT